MKDFFVARHYPARRLSQVTDKSNYSSLLPKWKCRAPVEVTGPANILEDKHVSRRREDRTSLRRFTTTALRRCLSYRSYIQHGHIDNYSRQSTMMLCILASIHLNPPPANSLHQLRSLRRPSTMMYRLLKNNSLHRACRQSLITNLQSFNLQIPKRMFTRSEWDQVLRNHMTAAKTRGFQQSGCIRRPDVAGTSQCCSLQGGTTHPENSTYTGRR